MVSFLILSFVITLLNSQRVPSIRTQFHCQNELWALMPNPICLCEINLSFCTDSLCESVSPAYKWLMELAPNLLESSRPFFCFSASCWAKTFIIAQLIQFLSLKLELNLVDYPTKILLFGCYCLNSALPVERVTLWFFSKNIMDVGVIMLSQLLDNDSNNNYYDDNNMKTTTWRRQ